MFLTYCLPRFNFNCYLHSKIKSPIGGRINYDKKTGKKFLWPYQQAVNELKVKFRGLRVSYLDQTNHSPIEFVTGRVKPVESIEEKLTRRYVSEELIEQDLQDIAGIRIMCPFIEDVYQVIDVIHSRTDMTVVEERDYIENDKPSGYRSYHMVIEYPVYQYNEEKKWSWLKFN